MSNAQITKAQQFLAIAPQFKLGNLVTESQHPDTLELSHLAKEDLPQAIRTLQKIDETTLAVLRGKLTEIVGMAEVIQETLSHGGNIFLCGCGATGRLSLSLETLWRELHPENTRVISFMAGGDIALIKSVEEFEDHPEYGERQLLELGFTANDLLISTTEGGETPFVIGATETAANVSKRPPYFLYCNPDQLLNEVAERSKQVIANPAIRKINLTVGPMAISGSTRMQASTILMLAVGLALTHAHEVEKHVVLTQELDTLSEFYNRLDLAFLQAFIETESAIYQNHDYVFYETGADFAITVLTDTTERAPTFSLYPFENMHDRGQPAFKPSLCYLVLPAATNVQDAWHLLLGRAPRALDWPGFEGRVDLQRLYGHDFSRNILQARQAYLADSRHVVFSIQKAGTSLTFCLDACSHTCTLDGLSRLSEHLVLKMLLNIHSTLVMGRLGRYEGNLMTYVRPSNNKLIDRTIRYVQLLLRQRGIEHTYEQIAYACFQEMAVIQPDEPIVLRTLKRLTNEAH